jgi:hypothetical protein
VAGEYARWSGSDGVSVPDVIYIIPLYKPHNNYTISDRILIDDPENIL